MWQWLCFAAEIKGIFHCRPWLRALGEHPTDVAQHPEPPIAATRGGWIVSLGARRNESP